MRAIRLIVAAAIVAGFGGAGSAAVAAESIHNDAQVPGSWSQACTEGVLAGSVLTAMCYKEDGTVIETALDLNTCARPASAGNKVGVLICESGAAPMDRPTGEGGGLGTFAVEGTNSRGQMGSGSSARPSGESTGGFGVAAAQFAEPEALVPATATSAVRIHSTAHSGSANTIGVLPNGA